MEVKSFIFVTGEGHTFQPKSNTAIPDVENLQVLGFAEGINHRQAFENLLKENRWLHESSFNKVFCFELKDTDYHKLLETFFIEGNT